MRPGSVPTPRCGRRAWRRCRHSLDRAADDHRSGFNAMRSTSRSRSKPAPAKARALALSLSAEAWQTILGAREPRIGSPRALPGCGCGRGPPAHGLARGMLGVRDLLVKQRTMLINAIRGYAAEFGITAAKGAKQVTELL